MMRIHVHGNCVAKPMAEILTDTHSAWQVSYDTVHLVDIDKEMSAYEASIRSADLIIANPVSAAYRNEERFTLDWVFDNRKDGSVVAVSVPFYFEGYFPELRGMGDLDSYQMPYFDYTSSMRILAE